MKDLLSYYTDCFNLVDAFHFNSEVTKGEYERVLGKVNGTVIPITHSRIRDNRTLKEFSSKGLVVGFIGSLAPFKGFKVLAEAASGIDARIIVWGGGKTRRKIPRIQFEGVFQNDQMPDIYKSIDVLVVPSVWKETFSFVTLEALSFGTPVIVSDNVGAKDIIRDYAPSFVYSKPEELRELLSKLVSDKSPLKEFNRRLVEGPWRFDVLGHANVIVDTLYKTDK